MIAFSMPGRKPFGGAFVTLLVLILGILVGGGVAAAVFVSGYGEQWLPERPFKKIEEFPGGDETMLRATEALVGLVQKSDSPELSDVLNELGLALEQVQQNVKQLDEESKSLKEERKNVEDQKKRQDRRKLEAQQDIEVLERLDKEVKKAQDDLKQLLTEVTKNEKEKLEGLAKTWGKTDPEAVVKLITNNFPTEKAPKGIIKPHVENLFMYHVKILNLMNEKQKGQIITSLNEAGGANGPAIANLIISEFIKIIETPETAEVQEGPP